MKQLLAFSAALLLCVCLMSASGLALVAFTNDDIYEVNSGMIIRVSSEVVQNVTVTTYANNATSDTMDTLQINITETGFTSVTHSQSLPIGEYKMTFVQGSESVTIYFDIVNEILYPDMKLMGSASPIIIDTSLEIDGIGAVNGNFSDILGLNLSRYAYYGNYSNLTGDGKMYHFVVLDENSAGVYDTVYVDDDKDFQLFVDSEDNATYPFLETSEGLEDMIEIDSSNRFIIADIDTSTGKDLYLIVPRSSPTFTSSDMLYMLDLLSHENDTIVQNKTVNITIYDESDAIVNTTLIDIGNDGYANASVNLSGYSSGKYYIYANDTPVDVFKVETFKLHAKMTDLSGNPQSTFSPGSKAKVWAVARDVNGDLINLDGTPSGTLLLPNGTTRSITFSAESTGVYTAETSSFSITGEHKVTISGTKVTDTEDFKIGFNVASINMEIMTLNPKYLDEGPGEGTMVSAFAPNANISAAVFMINASKGSAFKSGGPPCGSDGTSCIQTPCTNAQFGVVIKDDKGNKYELENGNYSAMTVDNAASLMGVEGPPEPGMGEQCMIMVWGNNTWAAKSGNYKMEITFSNSSVGDMESGASFSIQRLLAMGSTVDFKGDSFSFFAPNSTVRVKLEIRDMVTDEFLSGNDIKSVNIIEMWKEWPNRKNALTEMNFNKSQLNESLSSDKITFTSPPEEGFYVAKFRFKANVSGTLTDGTGMLFFELKKYMIFAELNSMGEGNWYVKAGQNISLSVTIMDIDMGAQYGKGTQASCTGCEGLVATIDSLRNEQFFKEMEEGTDYTLDTGVVANSTSGATIKIIPSNLPSGWYGVDILLNDTDSGATYYGWGWFEIRNFWVEVFEVEEQGGNYSKSESRGPGGVTVPVSGDKLIGVVAYSPPTKDSPPTPLQITTASVEGLSNSIVWPPLPVDTSKYNATALGSVDIQECWGDQCEKFPIYLINLSVADDIDESNYELSIRATASGAGSDIGTVRLTVSSYQVNYATNPVTKMYEWPAVYASTENFTMVVTATDFDDNPHNITNITIKEVFSEKVGRPVKLKYGQNYTNNCTGNTSYCTIDVFLSGFSSGMYFIKMNVEDNSGSEQNIEFEFEMKNLLFSVPRIYEGWTHESSSRDNTVDAWNSEDSCERDVWMQDDSCSDCEGNVSMDGGTANITFPVKNTSNQYYWSKLCLDTSDGRWDMIPSGQTQCNSGGKIVYMISNSTNVWINDSSDLSTAATLTNSSTFIIANYSGFTWLVNKIEEDGRKVQMKHANGIICGRNDLQFGDGSALKIVPPAAHVNYSSFYHGPAYIVGDIWGGGNSCEDCIETQMNITDRPVYVYHNTTHLWLYKNASSANFTDNSSTQGPTTIGNVINDGYGGRWKVVSISSSQVTLRGENILANGVMVNTSLSTSGTIYIGELREDEMGFENKISEQKEGLDLDGDGEKNSTLFFLIIDSSTGYDKLAYSDSIQKWNFTNTSRVISANDNSRANRQVGIVDKLTLLSIDPRASSVKFYDPNVRGDWAELGDSKINDNVTIPIVVKTPAGNDVAANISIPRLKLKTSSGVNFITPSLNATEINGVGEIRINVSNLGLGAGRYEFEILANSSTYGQEQLNEWLWPRTVIRNFLVDSYSGYGGIITDFAMVNFESYNERTSRVRDLFTVNESGKTVITGAMEFLQNQMLYPPGCSNFVEPPNAGSDTGNATYILDRLDRNYYAYMTPANASRIWIKKTDCNFSSGTSYAVNENVNITLGTDVYMLYVLNGTIGNAALGPLGINLSFEPSGMDTWGQRRSPRWQIMSMNKSGKIYNAIFTNDSSLSYPQADTWGADMITKAVRIDDDGNFTGAASLTIGSTFSGNEYLASIGPDPWSGLKLADSTNLSGIGITSKPGIDIRVYDSTPVYLGKINESDSSLDTDLNLDDDKTDVFYMIAFDEFDDGSKTLTRIYIDDDLNITEPWWANSSNVRPDRYYEYAFYDFYGNEQGSISEQEGNPPTGMWGGNIRFAPENQSLSWEESAGWNIKAYNGTNLIVEKNVWQLNFNKTISLTVKVFDFTQSAISGATVTLEKLNRFGGGQPFKELNETAGDYTLNNVQNVTDSNGYAMLKISPPNPQGWLNDAEYIASIKVEYNSMEETVRNWFRVGQGFK